ncbi:Zn-dependent hydrolase [Paenibacillus macerans]|uniref:allantoate deiminase n=1 Tax=Paenibacillus macerans TaxID=44252 RepID=UPI000ED10F8D|nr:allantoate deiminase [Paenibacillus macerans]GBK60275.1 Zn-dependent hydrolase [Paenibacillus macerans]GBK66573.1 Zn-dependent hydrolase [Paenibacillus macerans]GIP12218.1 Zn-dependent hydrolase [Paenibacillus macerans]
MIKLEPQTVDDLMDWISGISDRQGPGTTRLLYSKSWLEAQNALKEKFEELGMTVEFDEVGNLFATLEGTDSPEEIIATGSHIDTVDKGGRLDGQLGIIAGYIAIKELLKKKGKPKKTLQIISMAEEEGSRFPYAFWGSKNIFGIADRNDVEHIKDAQGVSFVDAMHESGFNFLEGKPRHNKISAFIELHIEQGNFLENTHKQVGVVNAIVGQKRYDITLKGQANHAGTTLMEYRKDTVECMARIITQSIDKAKKEGNPLVLTFGKVEPKPNTVNVVPGETLFSMDCRHTEEAVLDRFTQEIERDMKDIARQMGIDIHIDHWMNEKPVPMDPEIIRIIESVCKDNKLNYEVMHSGAGHDSQIFAAYVPTAMIFVPSIDGISHNPREHTEAVDIVPGIQVLAGAIEKLAY